MVAYVIRTKAGARPVRASLDVRLEVPLNSFHADREHINEIEALGVLGEHRREDAAERSFSQSNE
jgi:hypothetical protein